VRSNCWLTISISTSRKRQGSSKKPVIVIMAKGISAPSNGRSTGHIKIKIKIKTNRFRRGVTSLTKKDVVRCVHSDDVQQKVALLHLLHAIFVQEELNQVEGVQGGVNRKAARKRKGIKREGTGESSAREWESYFLYTWPSMLRAPCLSVVFWSAW